MTCTWKNQHVRGQLFALSKALTRLLRHNAAAEGLPLRPDGLFCLDDVVRTREMRQQRATSAELLQAICVEPSKRAKGAPRRGSNWTKRRHLREAEAKRAATGADSGFELLERERDRMAAEVPRSCASSSDMFGKAESRLRSLLRSDLRQGPDLGPGTARTGFHERWRGERTDLFSSLSGADDEAAASGQQLDVLREGFAERGEAWLRAELEKHNVRELHGVAAAASIVTGISPSPAGGDKWNRPPFWHEIAELVEPGARIVDRRKNAFADDEGEDLAHPADVMALAQGGKQLLHWNIGEEPVIKSMRRWPLQCRGVPRAMGGQQLPALVTQRVRHKLTLTLGETLSQPKVSKATVDEELTPPVPNYYAAEPGSIYDGASGTDNYDTYKRRGDVTPKQADEEGDQQTAKPRGTANPCRTDDGRAPRVTLERSDARDHRGKKEQEVEDSPPDWAGSSDDDERATHQNLSRDRNWPWRAAGRPWDHGNSSGVLAQRPNEPSGEPRRRQRDSIEDRGDGGAYGAAEKNGEDYLAQATDSE
ncbi:hypothetical protein AK812_SmicGene41810 [Symbiodinium microadriaticum]|uniref:2'-phosphotransferase n=1 Tax=Symbiodinium microadriaticum TaxID=2951 RepID=A0A1Q9C555_SYMMI|nr:hypothetical protein AK812_SmicGene41810 [Symbiodinium microadriaticum]